jgi:hypothetical protein
MLACSVAHRLAGPALRADLPGAAMTRLVVPEYASVQAGDHGNLAPRDVDE